MLVERAAPGGRVAPEDGNVVEGKPGHGSAIRSRRREGTALSDRYRGRDRRGLLATSQPLGRSFLLVASFVVLGFILTRLGPGEPFDLVQIARAESSFSGAAFAVALAVAGLCVLRWKLVGEAAALHLGLASGVYASCVLGPSLVVGGTSAVAGTGSLPAGGRIVTAALVVVALIAPEVDSGLRPWRSIRGTLGGLLVVVGVLTWAPGVTEVLLTPAELRSGVDTVTGAPGVAVVAVWLVLGAWALWPRRGSRRPLLAWFGLGCLVLATSAATPLRVGANGAVLDLGSVILELTAFLTIGTGAIIELIRAFRDKDGRLLASVAAARTAAERLRCDAEDERERTHEAQNVLFSIEAATTTLERYRDQLDPAERAALSSSISSEVQRLQRLVDPRPQQVEVGRFHPSEAIAPLVTCLRTMTTHVHVDVPHHLVAIGRPVDTVQAIHNVLENARRYGGGDITVRATLEHDRVVLRISDRGPGVAEEQREAIFERGVRGSAADGTTGSGLGLHISRELMRGQGGDLRLASPDGVGGAAFEIVLPGFSTLLGGAAGQVDDQPEDLRESVAVRRRLRLVRARTEDASRAGGVDEDDHLGDVAAR